MKMSYDKWESIGYIVNSIYAIFSIIAVSKHLKLYQSMFSYEKWKKNDVKCERSHYRELSSQLNGAFQHVSDHCLGLVAHNFTHCCGVCSEYALKNW